MSRHVRRVLDAETETAFDVLSAVAAWLRSKGRRQRISNTSFSTYQHWQALGVNYAVVEDESILGIFSLPVEPLSDWPSFDNGEPVTWLRALATHPNYRGQTVGEFAVAEALRLAEPDRVYLDCVSAFLPDYYRSLGFEILGRQSKHFLEEDDPFDITLLWHRNERDNLGRSTRR